MRRIAQAWNRAVKAVHGWPTQALAAPRSSKWYGLPFSAYGPGLADDVERFVQYISGPKGPPP